MTSKTIRITGRDALRFARAHECNLCMYNSPIEPAREGLTDEEGDAIAREDPSLLYVDVEWSVGERVEGGEDAEDYDTGSIVDFVGGDEVMVWWDSGVKSPIALASLRVEGARPIKARAGCADRGAR